MRTFTQYLEAIYPQIGHQSFDYWWNMATKALEEFMRNQKLRTDAITRKAKEELAQLSARDDSYKKALEMMTHMNIPIPSGLEVPSSQNARELLLLLRDRKLPSTITTPRGGETV